MIKINRGSIGGAIGTDKEGKLFDIVVKAAAPNKLKDIVIGGGMVVAGIVYLTRTAFEHGVRQFEKAELKAMYEADVISEDPDTFFKK